MYTSGRTVKSTARKVSPVAEATAAARKLVNRYLPGVEGVTVTTTQTADARTLECILRTTITYPQTVDASDLACAVEGAPGVVSSTWSAVAITITRKS